MRQRYIPTPGQVWGAASPQVTRSRAAAKPVLPASGCVHWWLLDEESRGECKFCHETRTFTGGLSFDPHFDRDMGFASHSRLPDGFHEEGFDD